MVGIVSSYQPSNWERDMRVAKSYGIDGFALNVGKDSYTESQLRMAYEAAGRVGFEVFISFDVSFEMPDAPHWESHGSGTGKLTHSVL